MGKAPAFQFYIRDWLSDPLLKMVSHTTKGIWIDLLCYLWESPDRGKLMGTHEHFIKMIGCTSDEWEQFFNDASVTQFADVTNCNNAVTVCNRRMFRDEKERKNTRLRVQKHRERKSGNESVTPPSSSSPSSSKKKKERKKKESEAFLIFYKKYPKKVSKQEAEKAFKKINPDEELLDKMLNAIRNFKKTEGWQEKGGKYIPMPSTWLNQKRWEDEIEIKELRHTIQDQGGVPWSEKRKEMMAGDDLPIDRIKSTKKK